MDEKGWVLINREFKFTEFPNTKNLLDIFGEQDLEKDYKEALSGQVAPVLDIAVDDSGNVYVTGSSDGASSDNQDFATIKYNSAGVQQWLVRYDGGGGGDDAYAMFLDESGSLYVTGESRAPVSPYSYDYLTIKYNVYTGDSVNTFANDL